MKFSRSRFTNYLQVSHLVFLSVTWEENLYCSPTNFSFASFWQTNSAGFENCGFTSWNLSFRQKNVIFTNIHQEIRLCLLGKFRISSKFEFAFFPGQKLELWRHLANDSRVGKGAQNCCKSKLKLKNKQLFITALVSPSKTSPNADLLSFNITRLKKFVLKTVFS